MTSRQQERKPEQSKRLAKGFVQTGGVLSQRVRKASEKRGFAETRLLTNWAEIVGTSIASVAQPIKVGYGKRGFGATLTLLTNGANAPILQAQIPMIKGKVNACYGYAAISTVRLTQTAATGFSEAQTPFDSAPADREDPDPRKVAEVSTTVADVVDGDLRKALEALGRNVLTRNID